MIRRIVRWLAIFALSAHPAFLLAQSTNTVASDAAAGQSPSPAPGIAVHAFPPPEWFKVSSTLQVVSDDPAVLSADGPVLSFTQAEILSSAGTFGDFARYLQILPGVVWNSDLSNEVLVLGGHPTENLFVVDGIEVPNVNHFSLSGSNGGFASMIDSNAIGSISMRDDVYDAGYSSRLSSLIEIHTHELGSERQGGDLSLGISGAGGLY